MAGDFTPSSHAARLGHHAKKVGVTYGKTVRATMEACAYVMAGFLGYLFSPIEWGVRALLGRQRSVKFRYRFGYMGGRGPVALLRFMGYDSRQNEKGREAVLKVSPYLGRVAATLGHFLGLVIGLPLGLVIGTVTNLMRPLRWVAIKCRKYFSVCVGGPAFFAGYGAQWLSAPLAALFSIPEYIANRKKGAKNARAFDKLIPIPTLYTVGKGITRPPYYSMPVGKWGGRLAWAIRGPLYAIGLLVGGTLGVAAGLLALIPLIIYIKAKGYGDINGFLDAGVRSSGSNYRDRLRRLNDPKEDNSRFSPHKFNGEAKKSSKAPPKALNGRHFWRKCSHFRRKVVGAPFRANQSPPPRKPKKLI